MPEVPIGPPPPRLDDLDLDARRALAGSLRSLAADLGKLSGGAGFCEDRGYGWSLESEKGYRENIEAEFERNPILKRLMHDSGVLLASGATIGDRPVALAEVWTARAALSGEWRFEWNTGEDLAETRHEITLGPVDVFVRADTLATTTGGRPFSSSEHRFAYEAFAETATWIANTQGIGDVHWAFSAVFYRLHRYHFTCDACTAPTGSIGFAAANTRLDSTSPFGPPASRAIDAETAARAQAALLANDFRVLHEIDPALVPAYQPTFDRVFCETHHTRSG